jgi:hypothetical protein
MIAYRPLDTRSPHEKAASTTVYYNTAHAVVGPVDLGVPFRMADEAGAALDEIARLGLLVATRAGKAAESFQGRQPFGIPAISVVSDIDDPSSHGGKLLFAR